MASLGIRASSSILIERSSSSVTWSETRDLSVLDGVDPPPIWLIRQAGTASRSECLRYGNRSLRLLAQRLAQQPFVKGHLNEVP